MKLKPFKRIPVLIAAGVIALACGVRLLHFDFFERMENITYDMRAREALKFSPAVATNLGFVAIDENSITAVRNGSLGYHFGLYWPRKIYGWAVEELALQGTKAVALDVIFGELRPDHSAVPMANGQLMESDDFFAIQMRRAGNVIIADPKDVTPPGLFSTNALALGDVATDKDSDGVLRRTQAFRIRRKWHFAFRQMEADPEFGVYLTNAVVGPDVIVFPRRGADPIKIPIDADGNFDLADFAGDNLPAGVPRKARPFTEERIWQMGIVLAAQELGLDLSKADVDLKHGKIILRGAPGAERVIPVDQDGYFYIDWCLPPNDPRLTKEPIERLLRQDNMRREEQTNGLVNSFAGKLVVVGSTATGNDLTDLGATPLEKDTHLASAYWNVASSILTGRFVHRASLEMELLLIVVMGIIAAFVTWQLRVLVASAVVVLLLVAYVALGTFLYVQHRYWLPLVFPVGGGLLMNYICLITWRVVFEQTERRRIKNIFSHIVSPKIVNELLKTEALSLGGARREITVFFADVRGFTEFTDSSQEKASEYVRRHNLSGAAADAFFDEQARETLSTVSTYLALVAEMVIKHNGTLDKYIGDCVMAFWGAPTPDPIHALACVRAAVDAQRAVHELNLQRAGENKKREAENKIRLAAGETPRPLLPILSLGTGINTGAATVGLMGSDAHGSNYTVFGREVNLASRLESLSGRGRIVISETTCGHLLRDDPDLAATCVSLPDATQLKGFRAAVKVYEVPWRQFGEIPADQGVPTGFLTRDDLRR